MSNPSDTNLTSRPLPAERTSEPPSGPGLWLPFAAFFFLMQGVGWIPETLLKIPALYSVSIGELLLAAAVLLNWRAMVGRFAVARSRTVVDVIVVILFVFVGLNILRNLSAGYALEQVLRNSRRMFYYTLFLLLVASIRDRQSLVKLVKIFTTLFMVGAASYFITVLFHVPLASRITDSYSLEGDPFQRVYHVAFSMAVVVGFIHFAFLLTGVRQRFGVPPWAAFMTATLLVGVSYYRSYYVAYLVGLLVITAAATRFRARVLRRASVTLILAAVILVGGLASVGALGGTIGRVRTLAPEVSELGGTFAMRVIIWRVRYDALPDMNPLLGAGFIWDHDPDLTVEDVILDPLIPATDNGYAAALVLLGLVGIALFVMLYLSAFWLAASQLRGQPPAIERALSLALLGLALAVLVNSIAMDNFYWQYAVLPNLVLLAAVNAGVLLERKRTKWGEGFRPKVAGPGLG